MKTLLYLLPLCMLIPIGMHAQTPPWNGNLTVLGFSDMTQATFVKPWTIVTNDPSGNCTNAAAVQYNSTDHKLFSCDGGNWTAVSGSGSGGGYATIQSNGGGLTQRSVVNFSSPIQAFDNAAATRTDISLPQASSTTNGYLSTADWTTFNNKQIAGNYLIDPGANGLVFRSNTNTTRVATSADIDTLLTNINFNTTGTGVGPVSFVPNTADTLRVFDATPTTGVTTLNMQEGAAQNTSAIEQILDNSGTVLGQLAFTNLFPYWLLNAPSNVNDFKSFGAQVSGDTIARVGLGIDQGVGFLNMSVGTGAADVGLERSSAGTLQVTTGQGLAFRGNLLVTNIDISGACTGAGCPAGSTALTQLTGDATAGPGPGSKPITLATVNTNTGTFGDATHVGAFTVNGKGLITAASSVPITGGGGGGASLATQLLDFAPGTITSTSIPFGASCTTGTPCYVYLGGTQFPFTNGVTLTLSSGTASDTVFYYVDGSGNRTMGFNSANTYACTGCEVTPVGSTTAFPATSYPLYSCTVTAGAFTACTDHRPILSSTPVQNGLGTTIAQSGSVKQFNVSENTRTFTGTSESLSNTDCGGFVRYNSSSAVSVALPAPALGGQFLTGCTIEIRNFGAGTVTVTPSGSTVDGQAQLTLPTNTSVRITSDGTNYQLGASGSYTKSVGPPTSVSPGAGGGGVPTTGGTFTGQVTSNISTGIPAFIFNNTSVSGSSTVQFTGGSQTWNVGETIAGGDPGAFILSDVTAGYAPFVVDATTGLTKVAKGVLQLSTQVTPATSSAACVAGNIEADTSFIYVCTATNTWKRAALAAF